jgi:ornithine decarboxylase
MNNAQRQSVRNSLAEYASHIKIGDLAKKHGTPLLIFDEQKFIDQYHLLNQALPGVQFYFALKAAGHAAAIRAIKSYGGYLDVATTGELALALGEDFPMDHCMHTHPIKKRDEIMEVYQKGVRRFVVENKSELQKFADLPKDIELLVRLSYQNPEAGSNLSYKFGVELHNVEELVRLAREQGTKVAGFCLHVGSQIHSADAYVVAIRRTVELIDKLETEFDMKFSILDIGGGFPVEYREPVPAFKDISAKLRPLIEPLMKRFTILAEPGRFVAAPSSTVVTSVVGMNERYDKPWYYIDDGLYGAYSIMIYDRMHPHIFALRELESAVPNSQLQPSVIAGPTCDSIDIVAQDYPLPKLEIGDLLVSPMMGAYTSASATTFNGIPVPRIVTINEYDSSRNTEVFENRANLVKQPA